MAKDKTKGSDFMIKKIAWDTFKNTGDIKAFMELRQIENIEKQIEINKHNNSNNNSNNKFDFKKEL